MDLEQTATILAAIAATYPTFQANEHQVKIWQRIFKDEPAALISEALRRHLLTSKYAPTISELATLAAELKRGSEKSSSAAWSDVLNLAATLGVTYQEKLNSEAHKRFNGQASLILKCILSVGWRRICHADEKEIAFVRRDFLTTFEELATSSQRRQVFGELPPAVQKLIELVK